jgi:hypothetical protein
VPPPRVHDGSSPKFHETRDILLLRTELFGEIDPRPEQERHLRNVTELYTRLTISFILTPQTGIKLDTTDEIREYAHTYILPMITTASVYPR